MPELPEVEAARRALAENCVGKKIVKAIVADDSKVIDAVSPKDFEAALVGKTIVTAHRKGKNMWIELDSPPFPTFQFGMAGAVYIKGVAVTKYKRSAVKDTDEWPSKYSKLFVELDDGLEFSFTDKRRFAKVRLLDNPVSVPPISELGPDALTEPMTEDEFLNSLRKKNIGIKALLLDQSFISGIGNWMADEVLYQAKIHPMTTASSLSKESCATLLKCINEVSYILFVDCMPLFALSLQFRMDVTGDDTLRLQSLLLKLMLTACAFLMDGCFMFAGAGSQEKLMVRFWDIGDKFDIYGLFYREKKPGKAFVDGKKLDFIKAGGRTTAYVPDVQKLTGNQAIKEMGKKSQRSTSGKGDGGVDESGSEDEPPEPKVEKGRKTSSARKASTVKKSKASVDESGSDDEPPEPKVVKGRKASNVRKASTVKKSKASVEHSDEDDDDGDAPPSKKRKGAKKPPAKSKLKGEKNGESQKRQTRGRGASSKKELEESDDDVSNGAEEEA